MVLIGFILTKWYVKLLVTSSVVEPAGFYIN
ncbi:Uncharacterised protein [Clostridioides difficile]|nr:Uncharacterised protein [Clostridioides difficile]VIF89320.1 Uncharacterised protein [Clostridioides difficile]VIG49451.1 Uncharacterised protein [Clostridioides difficile]